MPVATKHKKQKSGIFRLHPFQFVEMGKGLRWEGTPGELATRAREFSLAQWATSESFRCDEEWEPGDPNGSELADTGSSKIDMVTCLGWKLLQPGPAQEALKKDGKHWYLDVERVRLSDALILPVMGMFTKTEARERFASDFDYRGRLRTSRLPEGVAPIVNLFAVDWFVTVDGHLLCGSEFYDVFGWDIAESKGGKIAIRIGEFAANQQAVEAAKQAGVHYQMVDITTEEDDYDKIRGKPDVVEQDFVFSMLQESDLYITFDERLDREVFVLGDDRVAYREKLWRVPGFSIQAQEDLEPHYSTEQLEEVGATWLEEKPYGETSEHQKLQRTVTWGHGIYQTNGWKPASVDPSKIKLKDTRQVLTPTKPGPGRGKSIGPRPELSTEQPDQEEQASTTKSKKRSPEMRNKKNTPTAERKKPKLSTKSGIVKKKSNKVNAAKKVIAVESSDEEDPTHSDSGSNSSSPTPTHQQVGLKGIHHTTSTSTMEIEALERTIQDLRKTIDDRDKTIRDKESTIQDKERTIQDLREAKDELRERLRSLKNKREVDAATAAKEKSLSTPKKR